MNRRRVSCLFQLKFQTLIRALHYKKGNEKRVKQALRIVRMTVTQYKFDLMKMDLERIQMTQRDQRSLPATLQNELLRTMPSETLQ